MNIGEKIETIIYSRKSGSFGEWLGESAKTFGACRIAGTIYKVYRDITPGAPYFTVHNLTTGKSVSVEDKWDIGLIKESDFH